MKRMATRSLLGLVAFSMATLCPLSTDGAEQLNKHKVLKVFRPKDADPKPTWKKLDRKVDKLVKQGKYIEAAKLGERALAMASKLFKPGRETQTALCTLAIAYRYLGRYAEAEQLYREALANDERINGKNHPDVAIDLIDLGRMLELVGRYKEAEAAYQRALKIDQAYFGAKHHRVGEAIQDLARLSYTAGRYFDALSLGKKALALLEKAKGAKLTKIAEVLCSLGFAQNRLGLFLESWESHELALKIRKKVRGPDHPEVTEALEGLAMLQHEAKNFEVAEALIRQGLAIRQKFFGPDYLDVAESYEHLAITLSKQEQYVQAESLMRRALTIRQKTLGPIHGSVGRALHNLGTLQELQKRTDQAEVLYRRAMRITKEALGSEHISLALTLVNLGGLHADRCECDTAEQLYRQANSILDKALGAENRRTRRCLKHLSALPEKRKTCSAAAAKGQPLPVKRNQELHANGHDEGIMPLSIMQIPFLQAALTELLQRRSRQTLTSKSGIARCPDGKIDPGEDCDDGNTSNWDGCTTCFISEFLVRAVRLEEGDTLRPEVQKGGDFRVDIQSTEDRVIPPTDEQGREVRIWTASPSNENGANLFGQHLDADRNKTGEQFQINTFSSVEPQSVVLTPHPQGGFVVAWTDDGKQSGQAGVYLRRYLADGPQEQSELPVSLNSQASPRSPALAFWPDGRMLVVWIASVGKDEESIFAQRYDKNTEPRGRLPW
ncbi:MAG: tetratricopeptide repeat protein [Deltaproteobacteria bacterium]|nr:tetratricopeptide repeat protein [Deltaproteobacteria bacterium]